MAGINWADFQQRLEDDARRSLREAVGGQGKEGIAVEELVTSGQPHGQILALAEAKGASLIVMGIHGKNPLQQARCPVLTVRPSFERPKP